MITARPKMEDQRCACQNAALEAAKCQMPVMPNVHVQREACGVPPPPRLPGICLESPRECPECPLHPACLFRVEGEVFLPFLAPALSASFSAQKERQRVEAPAFCSQMQSLPPFSCLQRVVCRQLPLNERSHLPPRRPSVVFLPDPCTFPLLFHRHCHPLF